MARGAVVAATLATATGPLPARGVAATAQVFSPGAVAWDDDGTIVFAGEADRVPWEPVSGHVDEGTIVPGFVDCHVHLPFVGWRADEYEARLAGRAVPEGRSREDWVRVACDELIPAATTERLADAVDIYAEDSAFSVED